MAGFSSIERSRPYQGAEARGLFVRPFDGDFVAAIGPGGSQESTRLVTQPRLAPDMLTSYITSDDIGFSLDGLKEARERQILAGRNYLIIGAGVGSMGAAAALEIVAQGGNVMTVVRPHPKDNNNASDDAFAERLNEMGPGRATFCAADATATVEEEGNKFNGRPMLDQIFAEADERFGGKIDGVIITIGAKSDTPFASLTLARIKSPLEADAIYPIYAASLAARRMLKQDPQEGRILILTSASGIAPVPGQANYGAGKAAANHVVRVAARELSLMNPVPDIGINAYAPGMVDTKFVAALKDEQKQQVRADSHADRDVSAAEAGAVMAHLVSPNSTVSGKIIEMVGIGEAPQTDERGLLAIPNGGEKVKPEPLPPASYKGPLMM